MSTIAGTSLLERNLRAIARSSTAAAKRIAQATPREDVAFFTADDGSIAAQIEDAALCSKRRPIQEAERLVSQVDVTKVATIAISGFAAGHHVEAAARRLKGQGLIVVFEPDIALLRAVLERIDISSWWCPPPHSTAGSPCLLITDADDRAALSEGLQGRERDLALGLTLLEHPPSRARLGEAGKKFYAGVDAIMQAFRPAIMSALIKSAEMFRNATQNLEYFAGGHGVRELKDIAKGRLGVVVAAGPSLQRNIDVLARAVVEHGQDRFVIVAVQTVLKTLLSKGITPHFVVAVDYAEISRRFYEGLTREQIKGITLVVEPTVNPAVTDAWAALGGAIRTTGDTMLDQMLGAEVIRAITPPERPGHGTLERAATVAHLAYYLARHLGCEPVAMIGQDLGFTDGQYYAGGAAIHDVWASELNPFLTLETLEWQRIARMGPRLMLETDVLGRPVYTDKQMHSYLVQFERDFARDAARGLMTIDATEGGVRKANTTPMPLREVLETYVERSSVSTASAFTVPVCAPATDAGTAAKNINVVRERVRTVRQAAWRVEDLSQRAAVCLSEMLQHQADQERVNGLITKLEDLKRQVAASEPAFLLTQFLNQAGVLGRLRKDRDMVLADTLAPMDRQRLQIERDLLNVRGTAEAARELGHTLDEAIAALDGAPKRTRPPEVNVEAPDINTSGDTDLRVRVKKPSLHACAAVVAMFNRPMAHPGVHRSFVIPKANIGGMTALQLTLQRLSRSHECERLVVLTDNVEHARAAAGGEVGAGRLPVEFVRVPREFDALRHQKILAARAWARRSWRGGLGGATVFDEIFDAHSLDAVLEQTNLDAALLVSTAWCMVDPALCDELVRRCRENPERHGFTFSQAPPGLGACVLTRAMVKQLAEIERRGAAGEASTGRAAGTALGSLLGYWPRSPSMDLIAFPMCAPVAPRVRDAGLRLSACSPNDVRVLNALIDKLGGSHAALDADAQTIVNAWHDLSSHVRAAVPEIVTIELTTARQYLAERGDIAMSEERAVALLDAIARFAPGAAVSFGGAPSVHGTLIHRGDPLSHEALPRLVAYARSLGMSTHVRSELVCEPAQLRALIDAHPDIVSVDMFAETQETAAKLAGRDLWRRCRESIAMLLGAKDSEAITMSTQSYRGQGGWIVPRLTRRDATYEDIEPWYTRWLMLAGWAVLDPLPAALDGERITPLPLPMSARRRNNEIMLYIRADGSVSTGAWAGGSTSHNVFSMSISDVWRSLIDGRGEHTP